MNPPNNPYAPPSQRKADCPEVAVSPSFGIDSDSIVASCDCLTKTPSVPYHAAGCKYRLICERDDYNERLSAAQREIVALHASLREMIDLNETTGDPDPEITERARALLPEYAIGMAAGAAVPPLKSD